MIQNRLMPEMPRDRLRELLDAVLAGDPIRRDDMARRAHSSPHHFSRQLRRGAGESPVALRRRVQLERAAWRLRGGAAVTEVALGEGYESVEGFSRAFGVPPSAAGAAEARWLPAPNGIHFHPPTSLWLESGGPARAGADPCDLLLVHDLDDTRALIGVAATLPPGDIERPLAPGVVVLGWDGPEESIAAVLDHLVRSKEVWLAAIAGDDAPAPGPRDAAALLRRHDAVAPRWLGAVRRIIDEGRCDDVLIDALCDPPESFVLGTVIAHVITYSAHRRMAARAMLRAAGTDAGDGDPIMWSRDRGGLA